MELQEEPNNFIFPEQGNGSTTTRVRMYLKLSPISNLDWEGGIPYTTTNIV